MVSRLAISKQKLTDQCFKRHHTHFKTWSCHELLLCVIQLNYLNSFTAVAHNHVELGAVYFPWLEQTQEGWDDLEAFLSLQGILNHQAYWRPPKCFPQTPEHVKIAHSIENDAIWSLLNFTASFTVFTRKTNLNCSFVISPKPTSHILSTLIISCHQRAAQCWSCECSNCIDMESNLPLAGMKASATPTSLEHN